MTKWASGAEIAKHRGQSRQWVNRKLKGSEVPRNGTKFHFEQANEFLDTHTEFKKNSRQKQKVPELLESQIRKEYALARIKEIEAQQKEGSVVLVEDAKTLFFRLGRAIRDHVLSVEDRLAGPVAAETDFRTVKALIHHEMVGILRIMETFKL